MTDASLAIERALTPDERAAILARFAPPGSRMHGAKVADILSMMYDSDYGVSRTDPFWEAHSAELRWIPEVSYAVTALVALGRELTVDAVAELCQRAGESVRL